MTSGILISCCNAGTGAYSILYYDLQDDEFFWIRVDDLGINLRPTTGATGLCYSPGRGYFAALQGFSNDAARILHFDEQFSFVQELIVPDVKDVHSIRAYDNWMYVASTRTNEIYMLNLDNPAKVKVRYRLIGTDAVSNSHLNDYVQFQGKEYVLGHSNPFSSQPKRNGFVYCLTDEKVVLEGLRHPHTLFRLNDRLTVLDSERSAVIFVEDGLSKPWLAIPGCGITRGACEVDNVIYLASSSRRLYSRKRGLFQINVRDDEKVPENEIYMSWFHRIEKGEPHARQRKSLSEIAFEIYDLLPLKVRPPAARLIANPAAITAQVWRSRTFQLERDAAAAANIPERTPKLLPRQKPAPVRAAAPNNVSAMAKISESAFADDKENFYVVQSKDARKTIVAFAGLKQLTGGMTPYNFMNSLRDVNANVVFVRDPLRTWYNGPIRGLGKRADGIGAQIKSIVAKLGSQDLYLLGSSSGGFAALAFAEVLKPRRVLVFSPQTTIDSDYLELLGETRWLSLIRKIKEPTCVDVVPMVTKVAANTACEIIVGTQVPLDVIYAERLSKLPNVTVHYLDSQHNTAMHLKRKGMLGQVLWDFVEGTPLNIPVDTQPAFISSALGG